MVEQLTLQEALQLFRDNYQRFEILEGRKWGAEGAMIEMVKQVGELAKYVMVAEDYYSGDVDHMHRAREIGFENVKDAIGDELADVFSMVIRMADHYGIDFEQAHVRARKAEDEFLRAHGA